MTVEAHLSIFATLKFSVNHPFLPLKKLQFRLVLVITLSAGVGLVSSCKHAEKTVVAAEPEPAKTDTVVPQKTNIHKSGQVQGGTIINGPAPNNSPNGSKPK